MKHLTPLAGLALMLMLPLASCKQSQNTPDPNPSPNPAPAPAPSPQTNAHFDVWVPMGEIAGMEDDGYIVHRAADLTDGSFTVQGSGVDVTGRLKPETILKGKYYYQITDDKKFGKYQITESGISVIQEVPATLLKAGKYCHTWLDDKTLLLVGSNGDSSKVLWVKYDTDTMRELSDGELKLPAPPEGQKYNTSGLVAFRKQDQKILYTFTYKKITKVKGVKGTDPKPEFYLSIIDPSSMTVETTSTETRAEEMASTAFGELRQNKSFFDEKGNYYLSCHIFLPGEMNGKGKQTTTSKRSVLLRLNAGETAFDPAYNGYERNTSGILRGKITTCDYLGEGKALLYMQDPLFADPSKEPIWDSTTNPWVFYWIVLDLNTGAQTWLKEIPFGNGSFAQLALVEGDKVYIGSTSGIQNACVYVYDRKTGSLTKGLTFENKGFSIDRITMVEN